jgi:hypothetical protein
MKKNTENNVFKPFYFSLRLSFSYSKGALQAYTASKTAQNKTMTRERFS